MIPGEIITSDSEIVLNKDFDRHLAIRKKGISLGPWPICTKISIYIKDNLNNALKACVYQHEMTKTYALLVRYIVTSNNRYEYHCSYRNMKLSDRKSLISLLTFIHYALSTNVYKT